MIKQNKNKLNLISLLAICLLISACSGGGGTGIKETNYYVGSDGLTIDILQKELLDEVYEDSIFSYSMVIENKGASNVVGEEQAILTIGYDPYYIELSPNVPKNDKMTARNGSISFKGIELVGKSKYYPSGSDVFFYFPYLKTKSVPGQRSKPETQMFSSICYPYHTYLTELVCVDFDVYNENSRTQVCKQTDLSFSNQGSPVAITLIEVENQPLQGNLVRPVYTIHFTNVGQGTVLSPVQDSKELNDVCTSKDLDRSDFNSIEIEAWFSTDIKLQCTPEKIRLNDQEGIARCIIPDEQLEDALTWRQNYQAPLTVKLNYVYLSTTYKTIAIKRLNPYGGNISRIPDCFDFEIKGKDGLCHDKCQYCAANPSASECSDTGSKVEVLWDSGFGCGCSLKNCDALAAKGLCVPSSKFCAAGSYCCGTACSGTQKKYDDGKCYPQCGTCSTTTKDCLCGNNNEFELLKAGKFCSSQKNVFSDIQKCKDDDGKEDVSE